MKKEILFQILCFCCLNVHAVAYHKVQKLKKWGISPANYSGITIYKDNLYAIVSDKEPMEGFYLWNIVQDSLTGQIIDVNELAFKGQVPLSTNTSGISLRDSEDIVYCSARNSYFICGEGDQEIVEYDLDGQRTGYQLPVPLVYKKIYSNYGFEALAYDDATNSFYTITENLLPIDGNLSFTEDIVLRLQKFSSVQKDANSLCMYEPDATYPYLLDRPRTSKFGRTYIHGVVAMTVLGSGKIAVLEREAYITNSYLGSWVYNKLYMIDINNNNGEILEKQILAQWDTHIRLSEYSWANYEGMCLGKSLPDGRQTLILISDSQGGYGVGPVYLQDYIRVIVL